MITLRILLSPGRRGRVVDASGRSIPQPVPAPVIGSSEPLRIILLDPETLDPADPYGFDASTLRLSIAGDWAPATTPVYVTNALERTATGTYDLADPSGTRTAEAVALLGVLAERLCAWEIAALDGDGDWAHPLSVVQFDAPLRNRSDSLPDPTVLPPADLRGPPGPPGRDADPSDADPSMDGTASPGSSDKCSRGDHVHPSDTSRVAKAGDTMTGSLTVSGEESSVEVAPGYFRITAGSDVTTYRKDRIQKKTGVLLRDIKLPDNGGVVALQQAIAPEFSTISTYAVGAYCTHDGLLYRCASAVSTAGDWNASDWTAVCIVDEMGQSTPLPFDAEVEYVTVPAGAYVDPEIVDIGMPNAYDIDASVRIPTFNYVRFGNYRGSFQSSFVILSDGGVLKLCKYWADSSGVAPSSVSNFAQIKTTSLGYSIGGTTRTFSAPGSTVYGNAAFLLCAVDDKSAGTISTCNVDVDIAYFRFIGNTVLRDLVPVRVGTVGYLYDKISGRLFGNAVGSIPLVPGPDKATPTITLRWR